ncbi:hypothetical protein BJ138DRAFT_1166608 [Hygrophoropsis aurantiaca]|uniref:Uncharacterized protein n=1 Tax=Hygrophoropsis aurantiaca TaxID=72124 RepID=A0ACB7ZT99_9AGAM|nr:hypothetical protein BJ138DRAFT_1166608 [Hygrophoropsis aurantiaca]
MPQLSKPEYDEAVIRARFRAEMAVLYAHRMPMDQLPDQYRGPNTLKLHFGIPISDDLLMKYVEQHGYGVDIYGAVEEQLSAAVNYPELRLEFPFPETKPENCGAILALYNNHNMNTAMRNLPEEVEVEIINSMKQELGLGEIARPQWFFDYMIPRE